jgi:hypothetical protein
MSFGLDLLCGLTAACAPWGFDIKVVNYQYLYNLMVPVRPHSIKATVLEVVVAEEYSEKPRLRCDAILKKSGHKLKLYSKKLTMSPRIRQTYIFCGQRRCGPESQRDANVHLEQV